MGLFGNDNSTVTTTFVAKDGMSPVVRGVQSTMARFKKEAVTGFGLAAGFNVFQSAKNAIGDVVGVLGESVQAAIEDQKAQEQLNQTIKANVRGWDENTAAIEEAIRAGAQLAFTDDEVRAGLNQLIPRTRDIAEANRLNALAMDLARAKNMSLEEAATLVGKAYSGQVTALRRAGVAITNTKDKSKALAQLQGIVAGQAQTYAKTTAGSLERMNIQVSESLEQLGYALMPVVGAFADFASETIPDVVEHLGDLGTAFNDLHRFVDPNIASLQDLEFQVRAQAAAMNIDADAAWAYIRAQQVQQSQDEEVIRLKQRLIDAGYDEATANKMIADQLGEVGMYYNETTGEVERHATAVEEAADWLKKYNDRAVMVGGTLIHLAPTVAKVGDAAGEAADEYRVGMRALPAATMHAVVDMKDTIKTGKAGIIEQFRDLAWQSKHPFAQVNYEKWLERKLRQTVRKMHSINAEKFPGLVEQHRQLVQDIKAELQGLPGYTEGLAQDVIADLASIGTSVTRAMGYTEMGDRTPAKPRKPRHHHKGKAAGGPVGAYTIQRVNERGPEWLVMGSRGGNVVPAGGGRMQPIVVNVDGKKLFEIMDARQGRAIAMGG